MSRTNATKLELHTELLKVQGALVKQPNDPTLLNRFREVSRKIDELDWSARP